jgi:chorismate mutase
MTKAIRGAISADSNTSLEISSAACKLFKQLLTQNKITEQDLVCLIISHTKDLTALNSASALRKAGLCSRVPLFCVQEADIDGSMPLMIRMMALTEANIEKVHHIYLKEAIKLRPDLVKA